MSRSASERVRRVAILLGVVLGGLLAGASPAEADDSEGSAPLRWDPAWTHAGRWDYALTAGGLAWLGVEAVVLQPRQPPLHWSGPILFDQAVRNVLRGSTPEIRNDVVTPSWILLGVEMAYPMVVDVPYALGRFGRRVAWDLFWQDTTAMSLSAAANLAIRDIVGRARPPSSDCLARGGSNCIDSPEATRSFPGGHLMETTTATALICTQHLSLHLYGAPWDAVTCGAAVATDSTVAVLRLMTDNHYASDMLAGAALGFAFGWGIPVLMHLHGHEGVDDDRPPGMLILPFPLVVDSGGGLGAVGMF